ncbi:MAG TPA: DUF420 domain-containing protein, partial [Myxococcota bacterium]|nr:DUF420 domain-containing protein [Myxococcota bacterium]
WTAAPLDLAMLVGFALVGVRYARRGEIARHQRAMRIATLLVLGFLGAYLAKVFVLGREDQAAWSTLDVWVLRIHELFVLVMLVAGGVAWTQGRRLRETRLVSHDPSDPEPDPVTTRRHRIAGRTAVVAGVLGFLMAIGVLAGMYARASL